MGATLLLITLPCSTRVKVLKKWRLKRKSHSIQYLPQAVSFICKRKISNRQWYLNGVYSPWACATKATLFLQQRHSFENVRLYNAVAKVTHMEQVKKRDK